MSGKGSGPRKYTKDGDSAYRNNNKLWDDMRKRAEKLKIEEDPTNVSEKR